MSSRQFVDENGDTNGSLLGDAIANMFSPRGTYSFENALRPKYPVVSDAADVFIFVEERRRARGTGGWTLRVRVHIAFPANVPG